MAEIRKYYPPPEKKPEPELPYEQVKPAPVSDKKIQDNTLQLADKLVEIINTSLTNTSFISYALLQNTVLAALKLKVIELCNGNIAHAARYLDIKRSTFRASLKTKGLTRRIQNRRNHTDKRSLDLGTRPPESGPRKKVWPYLDSDL